MRYFVSLDGSEIAVDVVVTAGGVYEVHMDGQRVDADVVVLPDALSVRIGHRMLDLALEGAPPTVGVTAVGMRTNVQVQSERARAASFGAVRGALSGAVVSPMPGRVVKVLVAEGADVQSDQPVVVVEAMKMENELRAPKAGKVTKVSAQAGDRVEAGTILLEID
jgi:glutaconyl-CoA/methylmalonyl-CoA decarboxylase subunit gamma